MYKSALRHRTMFRALARLTARARGRSSPSLAQSGLVAIDARRDIGRAGPAVWPCVRRPNSAVCSALFAPCSLLPLARLPAACGPCSLRAAPGRFAAAARRVPRSLAWPIGAGLARRCGGSGAPRPAAAAAASPLPAAAHSCRRPSALRARRLRLALRPLRARCGGARPCSPPGAPLPRGRPRPVPPLPRFPALRLPRGGALRGA